MVTGAPAVIRRLQPADTERLLALVTRSFADEIAFSGMRVEGVRSHLSATLAASRPPFSLGLRTFGYIFELWVAAQGDELIGCYALHGRSPLTVSTVAVHPRMRRAGVGRALMEHAFERARQLDRRQVTLDVLESNEAATALYRSLDMREYDRRRSYIRPLRPPPHAPPGRGSLSFSPVRQRHMSAWPEIIMASLPPQAASLAHTYKGDYISGSFARWLDKRLPQARTVRRTVLLDNSPAGFLCVRSGGDGASPMAEILPPLYLPELQPRVCELIAEATRCAVEGAGSSCRLCVSGSRPEGWEAAESLGYSYERSWLYLYKDL